MNRPYRITTPRLGLRQWHDKDLAHYKAMNQDPDVMRFFPDLLSSEQTASSFARMMMHYNEHGYTFFAVDLLDTSAFIGFTGLYNTRFTAHFTPCVEIGWRLMKEYWGFGYATEAAATCLDYAFDVLRLKEVYAYTPMLNLPSERVMQKIGMKRVGTFKHPMIPDNPLEEQLLYRIGR